MLARARRRTDRRRRTRRWQSVVRLRFAVHFRSSRHSRGAWRRAAPSAPPSLSRERGRCDRVYRVGFKGWHHVGPFAVQSARLRFGAVVVPSNCQPLLTLPAWGPCTSQSRRWLRPGQGSRRSSSSHFRCRRGGGRRVGHAHRLVAVRKKPISRTRCLPRVGALVPPAGGVAQLLAVGGSTISPVLGFRNSL